MLRGKDVWHIVIITGKELSRIKGLPINGLKLQQKMEMKLPLDSAMIII